MSLCRTFFYFSVSRQYAKQQDFKQSAFSGFQPDFSDGLGFFLSLSSALPDSPILHSFVIFAALQMMFSMQCFDNTNRRVRGENHQASAQQAFQADCRVDDNYCLAVPVALLL